MSDEGDGPRRDSGADEEGDGFDFLDEPETGDDAEVDDPFAELDAGIDGGDFGETDADDSDTIPLDSDTDTADFDTGATVSDTGPADFDTGAVDSGTVPSDTDSDAGGLGLDPSSAESAAGAPRDDPFDELGPADAAADLDDAFERMDVGGATDEDVWESLDEDDVGPAGGVDEATGVPGGGDTEHVVAKRTYCQQCPHFTRPPEVACTHEGTSIVEAVDFDQFRVRNCPMISEEDPTFDGSE